MYYIHVHVVDAQAILAHVGLCVLLPSAKTRPCRFLFPTCYEGLVKKQSLCVCYALTLPLASLQ